MSDESSRQHHHHHHHHHSSGGSRSSRAEGLSEDYLTSLPEDVFDQTKSADMDQEEEALSEEIKRSIEEQMTASEHEERSSGGEHRSSGSSGGSRNAGSSRSRKRKKHQDSLHREKKKGRIFVRILIVIVILLVLLVGGLFYLRYVGEQNLKKNVVETPVSVELPEEVEEDDDENLIVYNGERYWYNEDIITVLCIGVDREEFATSDDMVIGENGQADADVLLIFDKNSGEMSILNISRDCMVDLDRYNIQGQYIDTVNEQLCLSFAFGNGEETSCENTALSVSRLLYGMPINAYVAIDFESIATLNDVVGGVTVPITEDIVDKFPGTEAGSYVTLSGTEAVTYVRTRDTSLLDSNNTRMSRQKQYVTAFLKQVLEQIQSDPTKVLDIFNSVSDNMVTNMKLSEVTYFGTFFAQNGFSEENIQSVQGEVVEGEDGYAEFHADETALFETVLNLFYIKE